MGKRIRIRKEEYRKELGLEGKKNLTLNRDWT